jgi:hypothetical protein
MCWTAEASTVYLEAMSSTLISRHPLVQLDYLAFECARRSEPDGSKNKNSRKKSP